MGGKGEYFSPSPNGLNISYTRFHCRVTIAFFQSLSYTPARLGALLQDNK